jgi:hypothetical protein
MDIHHCPVVLARRIAVSEGAVTIFGRCADRQSAIINSVSLRVHLPGCPSQIPITKKLKWSRLTLRSLASKQVDGIVAACSLLPESPGMARGDWSAALYSERRRWGRHVAPPNAKQYTVSDESKGLGGGAHK